MIRITGLLMYYEKEKKIHKAIRYSKLINKYKNSLKKRKKERKGIEKNRYINAENKSYATTIY